LLAARVPDLPQYASMAWTQSQMAENVHLVLLRSPTRDRFLRGFQTVGLSNSGTRAAFIARQLDQQLSTSQPSGCRHAGVLWDVVALYPKGVKWEGSQPVFIDGAVVKVETELAKQVAATLRYC
jgi:hypothetical protein